MKKILSLDVWDTLIRREVYQEYPKLYTMKVLLCKYRDLIDINFRCKNKLYNKRISIEKELTKANYLRDGEYSIKQVFEHLLRCVTTLYEVNSLVEDLINIEVEYEKSYTYQDPTIKEVISKIKRDQTIFISDFYMGVDEINEILSSNGLDLFFDMGFSSCEAMCNKRTKKLYNLVQSQLDINSSEHIHIGDHEISDYIVPNSMGIKAIHFWPDEESKKRIINEKHWFSRKDLLIDILENSQVKYSSGNKLADSLTPMLVGFLLNIAEKSIEKGVDFIGFCTREGEFFHELWEHLFPTGMLFGKELPRVEVIEVSRMATFAPTVTQAKVEKMQRMWSLFKNQSVSSMLTSLNIEVDNVKYILDKHDIDPYFEYSDIKNNKVIAELFEDFEFCRIIEGHCSEQRSLIHDYFASKFKKSKKVAIVDIGWRGTIQDNLCCIFEDIEFHGFYLGLYKFINDQFTNSFKDGYLFDLNIDNKEKEILEDPSIYEMLFNSPNGSVVGYVKRNSKVIAEKNISHDENETYFSYSIEIQKNILKNLNFWLRNVDKYVLEAREIRFFGRATLQDITRNPDEGLIIARSNLHHNETFGLGEFVSCNELPSYYTIFTFMFIKESRRKFLSFFRSHRWVKSIELIDNDDRIKKKLLVSILKLFKIMMKLKARFL